MKKVHSEHEHSEAETSENENGETENNENENSENRNSENENSGKEDSEYEHDENENTKKGNSENENSKHENRTIRNHGKRKQRINQRREQAWAAKQNSKAFWKCSTRCRISSYAVSPSACSKTLSTTAQTSSNQRLSSMVLKAIAEDGAGNAAFPPLPFVLFRFACRVAGCAT